MLRGSISDKSALRKELIARRKEMPRDIRAAADRDIFLKLKPLLDAADGVFTYVSTDIEVSTRGIMEYCFERSIPVFCPVSGDTELLFYRVNGFSELAPGRYGILEPINRDAPARGGAGILCVVPALCADETGLRLGYGKGYYDRFLSGFKGKSVVVCYRSFKMRVPAEPHDKRADMVVFDDIC